MNSTDPRPNANGGFRNGRMQSTRNPRNAQNQNNSSNNSSQNNSQNNQSPRQNSQSPRQNDVVVSPLNIRGRAATAGTTGATVAAASANTEARIAGSVGINNSSYAYTFGNDASNRFTTRPARIESTADSNYRYEYYRDYQSNPASPSDAGGGGNGYGNRKDGNGGGGNGNGNNGGNNNNNNNRGSDAGNNSNGGNRHNVSFSFNINGTTGTGTVPEVNINGFNLGALPGVSFGGGGGGGGGLLNGLPVNLPIFGGGFPFGGRNESRAGTGFVNISPLGRF